VIHLNGTRVVDRTDPQFLREGRIALQVHKGPPMEVRFKDLMIQTLGTGGTGGQTARSDDRPTRLPLGEMPVQPSRPVRIFNGKDLTGWAPYGGRRELSKAEGSQIWTIRDGVLHGFGGPSLLFSPRGDYLNFRV